MSDDPQISVVVPFFNLENCVEYCVDSLIAQAFSSCEFVLIDDGSTDNTFSLLKSCARKDSRIRVLRKENGGLSDARNYGVEAARGKFISFVDGDDIVSPYYLESLWQGLRENAECPLVVGISKRVPAASVGRVSFDRPCQSKQITHEQLYKLLLYEKILPSAWAHLAPKEVYIKHPFPQGRCYEEISTIGTFVNMADEISIIAEPIYGYVARDDSIVRKKKVAQSQIADYRIALDLFCGAARQAVPGYQKGLDYFNSLHGSRMFRLMERTDRIGDVRREQRKIQQDVRDRLTSFLRDPQIDRGNKVRLMLLSMSAPLYLRLFDLFDKVRS